MLGPISLTLVYTPIFVINIGYILYATSIVGDQDYEVHMYLYEHNEI